MFKKTIFLSIIIFLVIFINPVKAQAAWVDLSGINPDSPFYFLDNWSEKISLFFTFSNEKKAEKALKYADEKLAEIEAMAEKEKNNLAQKAALDYEKYMNMTREKVEKAKQEGKDMEAISKRIASSTVKHVGTLETIFVKVPDRIKESVQSALRVQRNVMNKIQEKIDYYKGDGSSSEKESESNNYCVQRLTPAENPETGACVYFPTPCDVPEVWQEVDECDAINKSSTDQSRKQKGL